MGRRGQEPRAPSLLPATHPEPGELSQPQGPGKGQGKVQEGGRLKEGAQPPWEERHRFWEAESVQA